MRLVVFALQYSYIDINSINSSTGRLFDESAAVVPQSSFDCKHEIFGRLSLQFFLFLSTGTATADQPTFNR